MSERVSPFLETLPATFSYTRWDWGLKDDVASGRNSTPTCGWPPSIMILMSRARSHAIPSPPGIRRFLLVFGAFAAGLPAFAGSGFSRHDEARPFVHPGLLHTEEDFARMRSKVEAGEQPWADGWRVLTESRHAQLGWKARPVKRVVRGGEGQNFPVLFNDIHAAYQLALRWKISGEKAYAGKAIEILNGWSSTLVELTGNSDRFLAAGIYGYQFANVAEIMRTCEDWKPEDFERFKRMMLEVFHPLNQSFLFGHDGGRDHNGAAITNYWANWDLCNLASVQAIGVLCDRRDLYDEALEYLRRGRGNGAMDKIVYYVHPGNLGQWQESGRDQGHTTLGIALMGPICESAWNQGDDLYGFDNNRFLAGAEYVAKYNLGHEVPYRKYAWGIGQRGDHREQTEISADGRGSLRAGYEMVVNHYVNRRGIAAPFSQRYAARIRPERGGGGHASSFDQLGFGTLTETIDPMAGESGVTGLRARKSGGSVLLSWWGAAGGESYRIKRTNGFGTTADVIATLSGDEVCHTDKSPLSGVNSYRVACLRDGREAHESEVVSVDMRPVLRTRLGFEKSADIGGVKATLQGGAACCAGKVGEAVALDGKDGHVSLSAGIVSELSDFTIAAWVRLDSKKAWARIFDFGDDRGRSLFLTTSSDKGVVRFGVGTVYYHDQQVIDGPEGLPTGEWVHVAVTLSGQTGTLYVNGAAVGENPAIDFPPFRLGMTTRNWIGRSQTRSDPYLAGKVGDFRIYDGALSAAGIAELAKF